MATSKIFTIFYAIIGIGVFVALVTQLAQAQIDTSEKRVHSKKHHESKSD